MHATAAELRVGASAWAATDVLDAGLRQLRTVAPSGRVVVVSQESDGGDLAAGRHGGGRRGGRGRRAAAAGRRRTLPADRPGGGALVVALAADHPLARRRALDLATLRDAPWVHLPAGGGADGRPGRLAELDLATVLALVAAGLGAALLPDRPLLRRDGVVTVPLGSPSIVHRSELTLRSVRPAVGLLVSVLSAVAERTRRGSA